MLRPDTLRKHGLNSAMESMRIVATQTNAAGEPIAVESPRRTSMLLPTHGAEILADIPTYTNIEPVVQFDEVLA